MIEKYEYLGTDDFGTKAYVWCLKTPSPKGKRFKEVKPNGKVVYHD